MYCLTLLLQVTMISVYNCIISVFAVHSVLYMNIKARNVSVAILFQLKFYIFSVCTVFVQIAAKQLNIHWSLNNSK